MDAAAITSAAQAVHQELVRKLAEQARINRLADPLRRARSAVAAPAPGGSGIASCWPAWPGVAFPSPVRPGLAGCSRREKIAAQRAAERRAEQRRRILIASGSIVVVIAVVVAFIVIKANNKPATNSSNGPTGSALASVVSKVTNVPASTLDKIGDGGGAFTGKIPAVNGGTPLTSGGKPEMLYMGAEYCPYCAAELWSMIVALSRFGTFSGLSTIHSSTTDTPANIPTWTFHGSSYTSKYLTFTPVEMQTNVRDPSTGQYPVLEKPTAAQQALITKYDAPPYV